MPQASPSCAMASAVGLTARHCDALAIAGERTPSIGKDGVGHITAIAGVSGGRTKARVAHRAGDIAGEATSRLSWQADREQRREQEHPEADLTRTNGQTAYHDPSLSTSSPNPNSVRRMNRTERALEAVSKAVREATWAFEREMPYNWESPVRPNDGKPSSRVACSAASRPSACSID
jgi:hypothetical protein